jgi:hypothetical protein
MFLVAVLLITASTFAQAPEKISYQAIIRDSGTSLVSNQVVGMQISILQGNIAVYVERQAPTSNPNGLVNIEIGTGSIITGAFSAIDWAAATSFIKTEVDPNGGTNYTITGTSQLLSVPYAMHTKTAGNGLPQGGVDGQVLKIVNGTAVWANAENGTAYYRDADGDDYGDINSAVIANIVPNGYVDNNTDCDDNDPAINPTLVWYIGVDTDGDTFFGSTTSITQCESPGAGYTLTEPATLDCADNDSAINPTLVWHIGVDTDGDGFFGSTISLTQCESPGVGYTLTEPATSDCDDTPSGASINPTTVWYLDADSDNYAISTTTQCVNPGAGYTTTVLPLGDCNDGDVTVNPDTVWYLDADSDNYAISTTTQCVNPGAGYTTAVLPLGDCDDTDPARNPGTTEIYGDGIDNNCDDTIDDDAIVAIGQFRYGGIVFWVNPADTNSGLVCAVEDQNNGTGVIWGNDFEIGNISDGLGCGSADTQNIYANHGSNKGDIAAGVAISYQGGGHSDWFLPSKQSLNEMYINKAIIDATALVNGGAEFTACYWSSSENYDSPKENAWYQCLDTGNVYGDQGKSLTNLVRAVRAFGSGNKVTLYRDKDEDGYGDINNPRDFIVCNNNPRGYVFDNTDCNDDHDTEFPGQTWYLDADGDNYAALVLTQCDSPGIGWVASPSYSLGDCNDDNPNVNPGVIEIINNGIDDDCNVDTRDVRDVYEVNTFYPELGGYVIKINADGTHGVVAAMRDQGNTMWVAAITVIKWENHDSDGRLFRNWRVPTKEELNLMYVQRSYIGQFTDGLYCTSEYFVFQGRYAGFFQRFANGIRVIGSITDPGYVRAVRDF